MLDAMLLNILIVYSVQTIVRMKNNNINCIICVQFMTWSWMWETRHRVHLLKCYLEVQENNIAVIIIMKKVQTALDERHLECNLHLTTTKTRTTTLTL
jgi:hypothetical protein